MQYHDSSQRAFRKDWSVFSTLISNMALITSLRIQSVPQIKDELYDINMLGVPPGNAQLSEEYFFIQCLTIAFISECLKNYEELKKEHPEVEDVLLETLLDEMADRNKFLSGMRKLRNTIFHLNDKANWEHPDVQFFFKTIATKKIMSDIIVKLVCLLVDFIGRNIENALEPE